MSAFPKCNEKGPFDAASDLVFNKTHLVPVWATTTEAVCSGRWLHPERCTMAVIDAMAPFLLAKVLTVTAVPCIFLLLCGIAGQEPAGMWRLLPFKVVKESPDGENRSVVFFLQPRLPGLRRNLMNLTAFFSASSTLQRIAVWADVGLAWGLMAPHISWAVFLYVEVEGWCHRVVRNQIPMTVDLEDDMVARVPRSLLVGGLLVSQVLMALHLVSTAVEYPSTSAYLKCLCCLVLFWLGATASYCKRDAVLGRMRPKQLPAITKTTELALIARPSEYVGNVNLDHSGQNLRRSEP